MHLYLYLIIAPFAWIVYLHLVNSYRPPFPGINHCGNTNRVGIVNYIRQQLAAVPQKTVVQRTGFLKLNGSVGIFDDLRPPLSSGIQSKGNIEKLEAI